jgi:Ni/Co efflux regulator RcnB
VIIAKLRPVPPGHRYVVIDGEVLLIALATGLILDVFGVI